MSCRICNGVVASAGQGLCPDCLVEKYEDDTARLEIEPLSEEEIAAINKAAGETILVKFTR